MHVKNVPLGIPVRNVNLDTLSRLRVNDTIIAYLAILHQSSISVNIAHQIVRLEITKESVLAEGSLRQRKAMYNLLLLQKAGVIITLDQINVGLVKETLITKPNVHDVKLVMN